MSRTIAAEAKTHAVLPVSTIVLRPSFIKKSNPLLFPTNYNQVKSMLPREKRH
jgi:hypothetical protein